ncbi:MAG: hypothetical protein WKF77_03765 [Planctomycetaceae bacterium]
MVVIVLNAAIGSSPNGRQQALSALQKQAVPVAHGSGRPGRDPGSRLVPGDVVVLAAGAECPPMAGSSSALQIEAALTGESLASPKHPMCWTTKTRRSAIGSTWLSERPSRTDAKVLVTATGAKPRWARLAA